MKTALLRLAVPVMAFVAATGAGILPAAQAAEFSCSTAKLIVPWKPGGGTDVIFRIYANAINGYGGKPHLQVVNSSWKGGTKGAK